VTPTATIPVVAGQPPACVEAELVYDPSQHRLLLVGCVDQMDAASVEQVWSWDGAAWTQIDGDGPPAVVVTGIAYDTARSVVVRYGGLPMSSNDCVAETWEWDGGDWSRSEATPPTACDHARLTYDAARAVTLLFGGGDDDTNLVPETWAWDGSSWAQLAGAADGPPGRAHFGFVHDDAHQQTFLYGGYDGTRALDDFWSWDGTSWTDLSERYPGPGARSHFGFAVGADGLLLFGGATTGSTFGSLTDDTWYLTDGAWSQLGGPAPSPRGSPALGYDPDRAVMVLYGGFEADGSVLADTWEWDGTWRCIVSCD
jgi:hypothetical protein